jgi:predicted amidohydrolase
VILWAGSESCSFTVPGDYVVCLTLQNLCVTEAITHEVSAYEPHWQYLPSILKSLQRRDSMEITVALAQMAVVAGEPSHNEAMIWAMAAEAAAQRATLLLLPELWATGYDLGRAEAYAAPLDHGAFAQMAELACAHCLYVAGTALETNPDGRPFNTAALYGPNGERVGAYRKVHLWAPLGEVEHMTAGDALPAFDLPWGRVALAICYDLRFPELWRCYADAGAQLILTPAEWPLRRVEHWRLLLRARAVENQFFVVGCNRAGDGSDVLEPFGGHSAAVDPWARVLVEGGAEPGLFLATLDLDEVGRAHRFHPFLQDRRPAVYGQGSSRQPIPGKPSASG